jgi:hypothetical protein
MAGQHQVAAKAWLQNAREGHVDLIEAFEHAFTTLLRRSQLTLGDVTVAAIVERVLQSVSEQYPTFAAVVVAESGVRCEGLRTARLDAEEAGQALSFVLVEFLTVLGNLTAEILTPALHDELTKCRVHAKATSTEYEAR